MGNGAPPRLPEGCCTQGCIRAWCLIYGIHTLQPRIPGKKKKISKVRGTQRPLYPLHPFPGSRSCPRSCPHTLSGETEHISTFGPDFTVVIPETRSTVVECDSGLFFTLRCWRQEVLPSLSLKVIDVSACVRFPPKLVSLQAPIKTYYASLT